MFLLRLVIVGFLTFYSYAMGQIAPDGLNAFGQFVASSFFLFGPALYMLPTFEAWLQRSANTPAISAINLLTGWTLVGWVAAYAWALKRSEIKPQESPQIGKREIVQAEPHTAPPEMRLCPFCAEEVRVAAIKCKHCGSELAPAVP